jgi:excisionase family DNA binding protein
MMEPLQTLTPIQAAEYLGISEAILRLLRSEGKGPRHFIAGEKLVRCHRADLDLWIDVRLSGGWRRSGHKIWVQVSSSRPGKPRYCKRENPRLCRCGSNSLTFSGVAPGFFAIPFFSRTVYKGAEHKRRP